MTILEDTHERDGTRLYVNRLTIRIIHSPEGATIIKRTATGDEVLSVTLAQAKTIRTGLTRFIKERDKGD